MLSLPTELRGTFIVDTMADMIAGDSHPGLPEFTAGDASQTSVDAQRNANSAQQAVKALVLIVEDDEKSRRLLRDILQIKGYQTIEAGTAEEGLRLAESMSPALILMDIRLPGMSGVDALRILRTRPSTCAIPVVAVTASLMSTQQDQDVAASFDGLERKPISVVSLLATMQRVLQDGARPSVLK
jgi:two-component system, cell cycle response regulator DivK